TPHLWKTAPRSTACSPKSWSATSLTWTRRRPRRSARLPRPGPPEIGGHETAHGIERIGLRRIDLRRPPQHAPAFPAQHLAQEVQAALDGFHIRIAAVEQRLQVAIGAAEGPEIGRASCRERGRAWLCCVA